MNVLVTGSLSFDYIMDFPGRFADRIMPDKIHSLSLSFLVDKLNKQFGGTAGNIAYTLKLLGIEPTILACAGSDFGPYKQFLKKYKISTQNILIYKNLSTSSYFVITDQDDNQIGSFYVGAMRYAKEISLKKVAPSREFIVIAPNDPDAMKKYVRQSQELKLPYFYDPSFQIATFTPRELKEGIERAQVLIGNDYEIALIQNRIAISHEKLVSMVPIVITTLGPKGSIIETKKEAIHIKPAKPKNVSDPTGAGDAYRAGFIAGYLRFTRRPGLNGSPRPGLSVEELNICGQMGSVAAAYTVEKYGTVTHYFTKNEFIERYKENFKGKPML